MSVFTWCMVKKGKCMVQRGKERFAAGDKECPEQCMRYCWYHADNTSCHGGKEDKGCTSCCQPHGHGGRWHACRHDHVGASMFCSKQLWRWPFYYLFLMAVPGCPGMVCLVPFRLAYSSSICRMSVRPGVSCILQQSAVWQSSKCCLQG